MKEREIKKGEGRERDDGRDKGRKKNKVNYVKKRRI